jgi:hypothetical protein
VPGSFSRGAARASSDASVPVASWAGAEEYEEDEDDDDELEAAASPPP